MPVTGGSLLCSCFTCLCSLLPLPFPLSPQRSSFPDAVHLARLDYNFPLFLSWAFVLIHWATEWMLPQTFPLIQNVSTTTFLFHFKSCISPFLISNSSEGKLKQSFKIAAILGKTEFFSTLPSGLYSSFANSYAFWSCILVGMGHVWRHLSMICSYLDVCL